MTTTLSADTTIGAFARVDHLTTPTMYDRTNNLIGIVGWFEANSPQNVHPLPDSVTVVEHSVPTPAMLIRRRVRKLGSVELVLVPADLADGRYVPTEAPTVDNGRVAMIVEQKFIDFLDDLTTGWNAPATRVAVKIMDRATRR